MSKQLRFLFACHANAQRSPTAEDVCKRIARVNHLNIEASSAGISPGANRPLTKEIADEADKIFVMEPEMVSEVMEDYGQSRTKIICLDIPDVYDKNDPWLVGILENRLYGYLAQEGSI